MKGVTSIAGQLTFTLTLEMSLSTSSGSGLHPGDRIKLSNQQKQSDIHTYYDGKIEFFTGKKPLPIIFNKAN